MADNDAAPDIQVSSIEYYLLFYVDGNVTCREFLVPIFQDHIPDLGYRGRGHIRGPRGPRGRGRGERGAHDQVLAPDNGDNVAPEIGLDQRGRGMRAGPRNRGRGRRGGEGRPAQEQVNIVEEDDLEPVEGVIDGNIPDFAEIDQ